MRAFSIFACLLLASTASAQTGNGRFNWQPNQVLSYRVEHATDVAEVIGGNKVQTSSKVELIKRWQVVAVDSQGIATVQMSIAAMRNEQTRPNGEVQIFDSRTPEKSAPEMREQLSKFIGQTLAVLRVDSLGRVIEVKQGAANRFEAELPFTLVLPQSAIQPGQAWERDYTITLDPPLGTGEKHAAKQKFVCTKVDGGLATITMTTSLAKIPQNKIDQLPLLQKMPEGGVVFDLARGRVHSVRMVIDRQVQGHQGEGSNYIFKSSYSEQYVEQ